MRFETPPGRQAQVDFAEFRLPWGKRYALLVVLGYSRLLWCRSTHARHGGAHGRARGGVRATSAACPQELLFDQMKAVIIATSCGSRAARCCETPSFCASPRTGASRRAPAGRIARRRRAKSSGPIRYRARQFLLRPHASCNDADLERAGAVWLERVGQCARPSAPRASAARPLRARGALPAAAAGAAALYLAGPRAAITPDAGRRPPQSGRDASRSARSPRTPASPEVPR